MEGAVRLLRGGKQEQQAAPVVAVIDSAESFSGGQLVAEVAQRLQEACTSGRSRAEGLLCFMDASLCQIPLGPDATVLTYSTDPYGWHRSAKMEHGGSSGKALGNWHADIRQELDGSKRKPLLIITCLGLLLTALSPEKVLAALSELCWQSQVQGMLLLLHQDVMDAAFVRAVTALASSTVQLQPLGALNIHVRTSVTKRSGLAAATTEAIQRGPGRRLSTAAPTKLAPGMLSQAAGRIAADVPQLGNSQEALAKQRVILPHELAAHKATAASVGPAKQHQQLGAIYYERDSEGEYDSDVDPDDDLDI